MINWLLDHFNVQKGMYFDREYKGNGFYYFGSDFIEDTIWNYGFIKTINQENLAQYANFCRSINKPISLYIPSVTGDYDDQVLISAGYSAPLNEKGCVSTETWMRFKEKKYLIQKSFNIQQVTTKEQEEDFVEVFSLAYGGEKSPEKPYGDLPESYINSLRRSFNNKNFYHFICYIDKVPVSIATLCYQNKRGGLYNVGTKPEYEKRGLGLAVTDACINKWVELSGEILFLQTETGTGIDKWYERIGFEPIFFGAIYEKE